MITKTKTKKLFKVKSSVINKQILIKMMKNGEDKPKESTKLGSAFATYTRKSYYTFDINFLKITKDVCPDWLVSKYDTIEKELIQLAKSGEPRPNYKTKLGISLCNRLSNNSEFRKKIKNIRPDWLETKIIKQKKIAKEKKQILLSLVKSGKPRPSQKTKLGNFLHNCINKNSWTYDPVFINKIEKIDPTWLKRSSFLNKQKLITMAKNGEKRPSNRKTKEGRFLRNYTCKSSATYCRSFDKLIRELRPDWFRN